MNSLDGGDGILRRIKIMRGIRRDVGILRWIWRMIMWRWMDTLILTWNGIVGWSGKGVFCLFWMGILDGMEGTSWYFLWSGLLMGLWGIVFSWCGKGSPWMEWKVMMGSSFDSREIGSWSEIRWDWRFLVYLSWFILGLVSSWFGLSYWHRYNSNDGVLIWICMWDSEMDLIFWYDRNGFWIRLSKMGLKSNEVHDGIGYRIYKSYKGFILSNGLVWISWLSILDIPWGQTRKVSFPGE